MAVTADSVVVELEAKIDRYKAQLADAEAAFKRSMGATEQTGNQTADRIAARRARLAQQLAFSDADAANKLSQSLAGVDRDFRRVANAQRNLGRQFADVGASLASGSSPFVVLAQQSGQVADALSDTGGRAAKVAQFFSGPWGAALLAAGLVAGTLAEKLFKTGEATEDLVDKLRRNAQNAELAAQADRIFAGTQEGLRAQINATTKALADQNAELRTSAQLRNVQARSDLARAQRAADEANQRAADAAKRAEAFTRGPIGAGVSDATVQRTLAASAKAREDAKAAAEDARRANINLNVSRVYLAREQSIAAATPQGRTNRRFDDLANGVSRNAVAAALGGANVGNTTLNALTAIERQRNAQIALDNASDKKGGGRRGPSAETVRRRAEAAERKREREQQRQDVDDSRTADALADLDARILQSKERLFVGLEMQEGAARAAIDRADLDRQRGFERQRIAGQINETEEANLVAKSKELAAQEKLAVSFEFRQRRQAEEDAKAGALLDLRIAQLDAESAATDSAKRRAEIELQIIDLRFDELVAAQERIIADTQTAEAAKEIARLRISQLNVERGAAKSDVQRQERDRSPLARYARELNRSDDELQYAFEDAVVQKLQAIEDGIADGLAEKIGIKDPFLKSLMKLFIQDVIMKPIAEALKNASQSGGGGGGLLNTIASFATALFSGGGSGGGGSGSVGSGLSSIGNLLAGRASGGNVMAGKPYMVGETGKEMFVPAQSGKIYPTGALNAAASRGGGGTVVQQTFVLDARGGVVTQDLLRQVNAISSQKASAAGRVAYENSPSRIVKRETLGT